MDTKGKSPMDAISGDAADKGFRADNKEPLNQDPSLINMPYNQHHMVPPNPSIYGQPLKVAPLTVAHWGEPVAHTPSCILNHKAYKGGWKVLQHFRLGGRRVDKTYSHRDFGRFRSKVAVINLLDELWSSQNEEKKSANQDEQSCDANQPTQGSSAEGSSQSAEAKDATAMNQSDAGKSDAGAAVCSAKGKSAA